MNSSKRSVIFLTIILCIFLWTCTGERAEVQKLTGYNLSSPEETIYLPSDLHEISGIISIDKEKIACIQDENGILYIFDLNKKKITKKIKFFSKGDYEAVARVSDTLYVLRSDGMLYEISDFRSDSIIVMPFQTNVPSKDNEGLCYDTLNNRLLIACKEKTGKGDLSKDMRYIFSFDLRSKSLDPEPVYTFDVDSIREFAVASKVRLPLKGKGKGFKTEPVLKMLTSEIALHPFTNDLYLLSAVDYLLFVFNYSGEINQIIKLDHLKFSQAEGITFLENGDMLISNEGPGKASGTILRFNYKIPQK